MIARASSRRIKFSYKTAERLISEADADIDNSFNPISLPIPTTR